MRTYLPVTFPQNRVLQAERLFLHSDQYIIRTMYFFQDREPEFVCGVLQAMLAVQQDLNSRFHISADGQEMLFYVGEPDLARVHHVAAGDDRALEGLGFFRGFVSVWDAPLYEFFVQSATNSDGPGTRVWAKLHHALADGTSLALLGQRIADACALGAQGLAPDQVTSEQEECLHEENSYHAGRAYTDDADFWANHIGSSSEFPEDLRGDDQTCDSMDLAFEPELTQALVEYTKSLATPVSTYCLGLALLGAYLLRRFDSDAVPVLTASAGRRGLPKAITKSIRMQVNTLLLHCTRKAEETFGDFVLRVDTMLGQALKHSRYPLGKIVEHLHSQGEDTERLWNFSIVSNAYPDLPFDMDFPAEQSSPFGLIFRVNLGCDDRQGLQKVRVVFRRGAMSRQAVERMIEGIRAMAADLVAHPHKPVDRLALIGPKERQLLVDGLQTPPSTWGRAGASFVDYLREAAARYPGHIALCDSTEQLTYAEVDAITDGLAAILEAKGPVRGRFVALGISRCNAFALAIYAVLKAGGAYLPLDPDYPLDRVQYMLEDSQAPLLLVDAQSPQERRALPISGLTVLDIKELMEQAAGLDNVALPAAPHSSDPAYIIYTSGSTGKPKGVVISHRALSAFIAWNIDLFALGEHSRVALHSSFSFDAAVIALFPPLCAGGQLHSINERTRFDLASLYAYLGEHGITDMFLTTQICVEFLQQYQVPGVVISTGGEKLKVAPNHAGLLFNGYGPTECTVISTCHLLDASRSYSNIPIGRPMPGVWHYILDRNQELLPLGMSG
ncbi:MAG: AMP-binding protein, partial [Desulfovibrionales bacterium]|nr:AMP-binding protein [Desulfovibrionales bacterium]